MSAPGSPDPAGWLDVRYHPDLDPDAERAIRAAGLAWHDEPEAERHLAHAAAIAGDHMAVLIARYRFALYKHRYPEALHHAEAVLTRAARRLNIAGDWRLVTPDDADFTGEAPELRFWMFVLQAYGYVLLRLDREAEGIAVLRHLHRLDTRDQTRTRILLEVITRREREEAG